MDSATVFRDSRVELEKNFVNVALLELEKSGRLIANKSDRVLQIGTTFRFRADLLAMVKSEDKESYLWAFEFYTTIGLSDRKDKDEYVHSEKSMRVYGRKLMDKMGRILPLFYKGDVSFGKFSFVMADRKIFDYLVTEFAENYRVPFEISFIRYNTEEEIFEKEVALKMA